MFSENFHIVEKYNVNTQEHVSTIEMMPRRFTRLVDSSYLPDMEPDLVVKLNRLFNYKQKHTTDPNYVFDKYLYIEHKDNNIMSYYCKNPIRFSTIEHSNVWNKFISEIGTDNILGFKTRIRSITNNFDDMEEAIMGLSYNPDGTATEVSVYDGHYNIDVDDDSFLQRMYTLLQYRQDTCKGVVSLLTDSTDIKFHLVFSYPEIFDNDDGLFLNKSVTNSSLVDGYLDLLCRDGGMKLITSDQKDYIKSICVGQSTFELEYVIGTDGTVKDLYVHQCRVREFEDLTAG